jgi:carboxypeptidase C (cathepsin A)
MPASAILPLLVLLAQPQAARPDVERDAPAPEATKPIDTKKEDKKEEKEVPPVVTHHELRAGGRLLKYTATTGLMPLRSETGELEGSGTSAARWAGSTRAFRASTRAASRNGRNSTRA